MKRKRMDAVKSGMSVWLDLPEEVLRNVPAIHWIGSEQMRVENHRGMIEYTPQSVRVNTTCGLMTVTGQEMQVQTIGAEDIIIRGEIESVTYRK